MNLSSYVATLLALAAASGPCWADGTKQGQLEQLVRNELRDLSLRQRKDLVTLEICSDLCDVFQWRGSPHSREAWDFVAAYEHKRGVGRDFKAYVSKARPVVLEAAKRMAPHCKEDSSDSESPFECSWAALAKSKSIRVGTSAYSEGQRCFGWWDLTSTQAPTRPSCTVLKPVPKTQ